MGNFPCATVRARSRRRCGLEEQIIPDTAGGDEFRAVIRRNGSMTPRSMAVAVICFAVVAITIGLSFFTLGYWLILPFAGLEVLAVATAVAWTARGASDYELITVREEKVTVTQRVGTHTVRHDFQRYWTKIRRVPAMSRLHPTRLMIGSHGRFVSIGSILTEELKDKLARQIRDAIRYH